MWAQSSCSITPLRKASRILVMPSSATAMVWFMGEDLFGTFDLSCQCENWRDIGHVVPFGLDRFLGMKPCALDCDSLSALAAMNADQVVHLLGPVFRPFPVP